MKRLFIALALPDETKLAFEPILKEFTKIYPAIKWCYNTNLHLTLHFLGDIEIEKIEQINLAMQFFSGKFGPFKFQFGNLGAFPNLRQPRIFFLDCLQIGSKSVGKFQQVLGDKLEKINLNIDRRSWRPHLTLGRSKSEVPVDISRLKTIISQAPIAEFTIEEYVLFGSKLTSNGPVYNVISKYNL